MMLENAGNPDEDKRIDSPEAFEQNVLRTFDNGKSTMHGHAANPKPARRLLGRQKQGVRPGLVFCLWSYRSTKHEK